MKRFTLLLLSFAALALGINTQVQGTNLVAHYKFDHQGADTVAIDDSGNKLNLSLSAPDGWNTEGVVNGCLNTGGSIEGATNDDTLFQVQSMTLATYMRIDPSSQAANYIMTQGDNYGLWVRNDGAIRFYLHYQAPDATDGWVGIYATDTNAKDGYWHHIAVTFDTTDLVATIYIDGEKIAEDTVRNTGSGLAPPAHSHIWYKWDGFFAGSGGGQKYLNGSIDELMVYNTKLSATEIKGLLADRYPLNAAVDGTGSGKVIPPDGSLFYINDTIQIIADPGPGCFFKGWTISDSTGTYTDNPIMIKMIGNPVKVIASFGTTLVASYGFDETSDTIAHDASGNDLNLALNGSTGWSDAGVVNGCLNTGRAIKGSTDDDTLFQVQSFSFAAYVRINPSNTSANYIMTQGDNYGLWVMENGVLRFYIHAQHPDLSGSWVGTNAENVNLKDGLWHHVAVTFDTTDLVATLYMDGEIIAEDTVKNTGSGLAPPPHSRIWYQWDGFDIGGVGSSKLLDGSIDEAVFYASKLSAEEIKALVAPKYKVNFQIEGDGEVIPAYREFFKNDTATATAIPGSGSTFVSWIIDGDTITDNPIKGVIDEDMDIKVIFSSSLIAHYKLDHDGADTIFVDAGSNGLDLDLNGTPEWSDAGVVNGCLNTNGTMGAATDDDTLFQVQSITMAAYIRINPSNTSANYIITQGDNYGLWVMENGVLRFYIHAQHPDLSGSWVGTNAENVNLKDGLWHHVAVTFDTTDLVATLFIDSDTAACDTVRNTGSGLTPPPHSHIWYQWDGFEIGGVGGNKLLDGSIDEAVFFASKLGPDDIQKLVAQRYALTTSVTGNGNVTPADGLFYLNDTLMLTAVADDGWKFDKWDSTSTVWGTDNPVTVTTQGNVEAKAVFVESTGVRKMSAFEGVSIYPNPFHNGITISYDLEEPARVTVTVYNTIGMLVNVIANNKQAAGEKTLTWNGTDASGDTVNAGMYFIRLQIGNANKVVVLKVIKK